MQQLPPPLPSPTSGRARPRVQSASRAQRSCPFLRRQCPSALRAETAAAAPQPASSRRPRRKRSRRPTAWPSEADSRAASPLSRAPTPSPSRRYSRRLPAFLRNLKPFRHRQRCSARALHLHHRPHWLMTRRRRTCEDARESERRRRLARAAEGSSGARRSGPDMSS